MERRGPEDCWEWQGSTTAGYGVMSVEGRPTRTHRLSWELANGRPIPTGLVVCHRCDNPPCCNPAHLFVGTMSDNSRDAENKGRLNHDGYATWTHCKRGHPFHESNIYRNYRGDRLCRRCKMLHNAARYKGVRARLARLLLEEAS